MQRCPSVLEILRSVLCGHRPDAGPPRHPLHDRVGRLAPLPVLERPAGRLSNNQGGVHETARVLDLDSATVLLRDGSPGLRRAGTELLEGRPGPVPDGGGPR